MYKKLNKLFWILGYFTVNHGKTRWGGLIVTDRLPVQLVPFIKIHFQIVVGIITDTFLKGGLFVKVVLPGLRNSLVSTVRPKLIVLNEIA